MTIAGAIGAGCATEWQGYVDETGARYRRVIVEAGRSVDREASGAVLEWPGGARVSIGHDARGRDSVDGFRAAAAGATAAALEALKFTPAAAPAGGVERVIAFLSEKKSSAKATGSVRAPSRVR